MPSSRNSVSALLWPLLLLPLSSEGGDASYEGLWNDGERHGHGVYTEPDGRSYVGQWEDGKEHGHGVYSYANGSRFDGMHEEGLLSDAVWEESQRATLHPPVLATAVHVPTIDKASPLVD